MPTFQSDICPICKSKDFKVLGKSSKGDVPLQIPVEPTVVECNNCKLFFVNPMPFWTEDDFNILYDDTYFNKVEHDAEWLNIRANKNVASRFERIKKEIGTSNKELLEVGSGIFAFMCVYLSKQGWSVTAQEPSADLCRSLEKDHAGLKTTTTPFLEITEDKKFSLIYADSVFEHVPNPLDYIKKSKQLLEKGGILYFISPNEFSFYNFVKTQIAKTKGKAVKYLTPYKEPYHLIGFSKKSMQIAAKESGLTLVKYIKRYDYYWYHSLKKIKNPLLKYPVALGLYLIDCIGWGGNLEIMFKKE